MWLKLVIIVSALLGFGAILIAFAHAALQVSSTGRRREWLKYGVFFGFVAAMLLVLTSGPVATSLVVVIVALVGWRELFANASGLPGFGISVVTALSLLIVLAFSHLILIQANYGTAEVVFLFLIVAITDSFSQLWGKILGQHKLCPRLSPGKTVEGLFLGYCSAVVCSLLFSFLLAPLSVSVALALGAVTAMAATVGDLAFSFIKRKMAIKDFSQTLPGHGGVLDRFDSLVTAAPVFFWIQHFLVR